MAARLLVEHPTLVDGYCCGPLAENLRKREKFEMVGDSKVEEILGHVTSGEGALNSRRRYAGIDREYGLNV